MNSPGYYNDLKFAIVKSIMEMTVQTDSLYLNSDSDNGNYTLVKQID